MSGFFSRVRQAFTGPSSERGSAAGSGKFIVDFTRWIVHGDEIIRQYDFKNVPGPGGELTVQLRCRLEAGFNVHTFINFIVRPLGLRQPTFLTALLGADAGSNHDTAASAVPVQATPMPDNAVLLTVCSPEDAQKFLAVLFKGVDLVFSVSNKDQRLFTMPLANDSNFKVAYMGCYNRLAAQPSGTDDFLAQLQMGGQ